MNAIFFHLRHPFTIPDSFFPSSTEKVLSLIFSTAAGLLANAASNRLKLSGRATLSVAAAITFFYGLTALFKQRNHGVREVNCNRDSSLSTNSPDPLTAPSLPAIAPTRAKIALRVSTGGLVGNIPSLVPQDLRDWTLENDDPIPSQPDELILDFLVYDSSESLSPFLPASLFQGKKEGDVLRLKHRGKLLELTLDQKTMGRHDTLFETALEGTVQKCHQEIAEGDLGLSGAYNQPNVLHTGYTLENAGSLYKAIKNQTHLQEAGPDEFRKFEAPIVPPYKIYRGTQNNGNRIQVSLSGITSQVDIVLNNKFLCFYAGQSDVEEGWEVLRSSRRTDLSYSFEYLLILPWRKYFKNRSLQQMQESLRASQPKLENGRFTLILDNQ